MGEISESVLREIIYAFNACYSFPTYCFVSNTRALQRRLGSKI